MEVNTSQEIKSLDDTVALVLKRRGVNTRGKPPDYESLLRSLAEAFRSIFTATPVVAPRLLIASLEENFASLERDGLVESVRTVARSVLSELPLRIPGSQSQVIETFTQFFEAIVRSDRLSDLGFQWFEAAAKADGWCDSLALCETVCAGLHFCATWELSLDGELRRKRAQRLCQMLCDDKLWQRKRRLLTNYAQRADFPRCYSTTYSEVGAPPRTFDSVRRYIWREFEDEGFDFAQRDALAGEMIEVLEAFDPRPPEDSDSHVPRTKA